MKKTKLLFPLLLIASIPTLVNCNKNEEIVVNDLKSAVRYLTKKQNYTLSYSGNDEYLAHDIVFTPKSIGVINPDYPELTDAHIECSKGVYRLRYNNNKFVSGELLSKGNKLWGHNGYRYSLYGVSTDFLGNYDNSLTSINVKDKGFRNAYITTIGYKLEDSVNVDSLTLSYRKENQKSYLDFILNFRGSYITYTAHDFGTSKNKYVDEFLANNGTYFTLTKGMSEMRTLMKANNYTQLVYYFGEDQSGYIGEARFTPYYYASTNYGTNSYSGYVALRCSDHSDPSQPIDLNGCYMFVINNGQPSINPTAMYNKPDIVEFFHYPSLLKLWDNFELLQKWNNQQFGDFKKEGEGYYTDNKELLTDFSNNFSMSQSFEGQKPVDLAIDYVTGEQTMIIFYYKFVLNGNIYVCPLPFTNFGSSNIKVMDDVVSIYYK